LLCLPVFRYLSHILLSFLPTLFFKCVSFFPFSCYLSFSVVLCISFSISLFLPLYTFICLSFMFFPLSLLCVLPFIFAVISCFTF
jgi:hypothetical protein